MKLLYPGRGVPGWVPKPTDKLEDNTMRLRGLLSAVIVAAGMFTANPTSAADKPNIVVILADDLGNADLGYRGSKIKTPNIDTLAMQGVRFESYYGCPLCTPSRAALMTGRYPMRYGLQTLVIFPSHKYGLPTEERTLPQALKEAGYATYMCGKWHLGHADKKYWPQNRGFDHFYGNVVGEVDYFTKDRGGVVDWQRNGTFLKEEGYYMDLIGNEAVKLIDGHDNGKPMFLYFASLAPHAPYQAPKADIDLYKDVFADETKRTYAAMITSLDRQVGRIVAALEQKGMRENTLIFFTTDNGGATSALFATGARSPEEREESGGVALGAKPPASNAPFTGGKGTLKEGGVRLPAFANWPSKIKPGVVNEPLHHVDVMPTLLALAGGKGDPAKPFDGKDATATVLSGEPSPHDDILLNVELFRGAIRKGNWKLIKTAVMPGKIELFDLEKDPGEQHNLAGRNPELVKDLEGRLLRYAGQQKMSEWLKSQVDFLGFQGKTVLDQGYNVDRGPESEKPAMPEK
jgi:arylsulfatase A-like enzyme